MTHYSLFAGSLLALALSLQPAAAFAQSGRIDVPAVPATHAVPEGNDVYLATRAYGTQNYICMVTPAGAASWKFLGPQATLFISTPAFEQQIATHFLSANPDEQGLPRPTWQHSFDSSSVWGKVVGQPLTDPAYVAPGAIPWLLLEAAGTADGNNGGSLLSRTTYIQRVNTVGGIAPGSGCTASTEGTVALVPYATDYFFYRAARH